MQKMTRYGTIILCAIIFAHFIVKALTEAILMKGFIS